MSIEEVCAGFIEDVDGLRACAAVDVASGLGLAEATRPGIDADEAAAAMQVAMELFRGKVTRQLAGVVSTLPSAEGFIQEAQVTAADHRKFMAPVPGWRDCLLIFVTDPTVSVGLGWMALHQGCRRIAVALDGQGGGVPTLDDDSSDTTLDQSLEAELALPAAAPEPEPPPEDAKPVLTPRIEPVVRQGPRALFRS